MVWPAYVAQAIVLVATVAAVAAALMMGARAGRLRHAFAAAWVGCAVLVVSSYHWELERRNAAYDYAGLHERMKPLLRESPARLAHRLAAGLVREQLLDRGGERLFVRRRERDGTLRRHHVTVARDVRCDDRSGDRRGAVAAQILRQIRLRSPQAELSRAILSHPPDEDRAVVQVLGGV